MLSQRGAADVRQAGRARRIGAARALRAPRLAEDQAGLGLAQVHDLERRVVIDHELVALCVRGRVGLGDPQDRVVGVAIGAGMPIVAGLVEERVDLLSEGREAQQPRTGSARHRRTTDAGSMPPAVTQPRARASAGSAASALTRRARADAGGSVRAGEQPVLLDDRRASDRTWASGSTSSRFRCSSASGRFQKPGLGLPSQAQPAQGRRVVGQRREEQSGRGLPDQSDGRPLIPRGSARGPPARDRSTARRSRFIAGSGRLASIQQGRAAEAATSIASGAAAGSSGPGLARDDREHLGVARRLAMQDRQQAGRGIVARSACGSRPGSPAAASRSFRPIARSTASRSRPFPPEHDCEQGDPLRVVLGAGRIQARRDERSRRLADVRVADRESLRNSAIWIDCFPAPLRDLEEAGELEARCRASAGRSAVRSSR